MSDQNERQDSGVRAAAPSQDRVRWLDGGRGLIICFITVYHAAPLLRHQGLDVSAVSDWIYPYRFLGLALFFMVSGMNSRRYIDGTLEQFVRLRLAPLVWMVLLWTAIAWYPASIITNPEVDPSWRDAPLQIVRYWFIPNSVIWFLWALGLYLVISRLIHRLPRGIVTAACAGVLVLAMGFTEWHMRKYGLAAIANNYTLRMSIVFFPVFHLGYLYREFLIRAGSIWLPAGLLVFALFLAAREVAEHVHGVLPNGVIAAVTLALGVMGAIFVARLIMVVPVLSRCLVLIGRQTLPIYLGHVLFVPVLAWALTPHGWLPGPAGASALAIAIGLISIPLALGFAWLADRLNMLWLFRPPERILLPVLDAMIAVRRRVTGRRGDSYA